MTDDTARPASWFAALDPGGRLRCVTELRSALRALALRRDAGPLETALAAWRRTGQALSDPQAREVLLAEGFDAGDFEEVSRPEAPLPDGEYARVEIMGHDEHTGWVTEGTRAGQPVMVVSDWDGQVIAEVPGHSLYRFVPLATPLKRPEPDGERRALTWSGEPYADDDEQEPF